MKTPILSQVDGSPGSVSGPAANLARFHTPLAVEVRSPGASRPARVLVVVEPGFDGRSIHEILRREHRKVMVDSANNQVVQRVKAESFDVVVLCSNQSGGRAMELLNRITLANPGMPVLVVNNPQAAAARSLPHSLHDTVAPPAIDAGLLLRSVREALTEPRVKRLIRLTGSRGEPRYIARNARWLSEELQGRYSMPFHWTQPDLPIQVRIGNVTPAGL